MPEYKKYLPIKLNETWKPEVQQLIESKKMFYSSESLLEVQNKHPFYRSGRAKPGFQPEKLTKEKEIEKLVKRLNQIEAEAKEIRVKLKSIEYESKTHETKSENKAKNSNIRKKNSASEKNKDSDIINPEAKNDLTEKLNKEYEMKKLVKINDIEKNPDLQEEAVEPKSKSSVNQSKQSTITGENIKNDNEETKETRGSVKIKSEIGENNDDSKNMHISNKVV